MKDKVEGFHLSPQQTRLWLRQRDGAAYRSQCALLIEGSLKIEVLKNSFLLLCRRHEILRTTFHGRPGLKVPFQVISAESVPAWRFVDLSSEAEPEAMVEELFAQEGNHHLDFEKGPLMRLCLAKCSEGRHVLIVSLSALCADAPSLSNMIAETFRFYSAEGSDDALTLAEPLQYVDFSEWQNELRASEDGAKGEEYWREQDCSTFNAPALPFEKRLFKEPRFNPSCLTAIIEPELAAQLKRVAGRYGATSAIILLACWKILGWHVMGQSEVVVGALSERKDDQELNEAIGLFARWLPVKTRFEASFSFQEVLKQTKEAKRDADEWQEFFDWKPEAKGTGPRGWEAGFFPLCFEFEQNAEKLYTSGLALSLVRQHVCFDRFKIKLNMVERESSLVARLHYDPALFAYDSIKCLSDQYVALLSAALRNPEARLDELELIGERERERLLFEFNDTHRDFSPHRCIHELFEQQAALSPTETALVFEERQFSYEELNARANQLGRYLQELGVGPEVPVALCMERSEELVVGMLGILKAGGAYVPLEPAQPVERLRHMLEDVRAPVILTQQRLFDTLPENDARVVCIDADWAEIALRSPDNTRSNATAGNLVYLIFTSGSTGRPKGVAVEHRQLVNYLKGVQERLELPRGGSYATVSTFAADLGHTMIFPALCLGGTLHIISQERASDPGALADYFERHPIDCLKIVPSHFEALLAWAHPEQLMPRQRLVLGGEASRREMVLNLRKIAPACEIHNHYGPTETTVGVITHHLCGKDENVPVENVPLGRPLANTKIYLLDGRGRTVATGVLGELHIGGAGVARGYFNRPELTAERFVPDPFSREPGARLYSSGDVARYWPDGDIEFAGRVDNQVKFHGFRVELEELRNALNCHPQVRDSVVVVARDTNETDCLVAYYVGRQELEVGELRGFLLQSIIEETLPNIFVHLKKLPLTLNGKVNLSALPALAEARQRQTRNYVTPRTPTEKDVARICAEILGVEQVGIHDNFFELGGHSLLATRVITRLRETFQVELPLRTLFEAPTVEGLALAITQMQVEDEDAEEMARLIEEIKILPGEAEATGALSEAVGREGRKSA
jgi:amino acid adenylation domain-containing protein